MLLLLVVYVTWHYLQAIAAARAADSSWLLSQSDIVVDDPPVVLGCGTFGLVLTASFRGTKARSPRRRPSLWLPLLSFLPSLPISLASISRRLPAFSSSRRRPLFLPTSSADTVLPPSLGPSTFPHRIAPQVAIKRTRALRTGAAQSGSRAQQGTVELQQALSPRGSIRRSLSSSGPSAVAPQALPAPEKGTTSTTESGFISPDVLSYLRDEELMMKRLRPGGERRVSRLGSSTSLHESTGESNTKEAQSWMGVLDEFQVNLFVDGTPSLEPKEELSAGGLQQPSEAAGATAASPAEAVTPAVSAAAAGGEASAPEPAHVAVNVKSDGNSSMAAPSNARGSRRGSTTSSAGWGLSWCGGRQVDSTEALTQEIRQLVHLRHPRIVTVSFPDN